MLNFLPCVEGQKFPSVKSWSPNEKYNGTIGRERLLVCGPTSNGIEALDFDDNGSAWNEYWAQVPEDIKAKVYVESTPSGGMHLVYRTGVSNTNKKLARKEDGQTLIETRGYGGLLKVAPSVGYTYISGPALEDLELLSDNERNGLVNLAGGLNRFQVASKDTGARKSTRTYSEETPTDYVRKNGYVMVNEALVKNGWSLVRENDEVAYYSHPNATNRSDIHLSVHKDGGWVHNWSGNKAYPFDEDRTYTAFESIAMLEFNGDQSECGRYVRDTYLTGAGGTGAGADIDFGTFEEFEKYEEQLPVVEYPLLDINMQDVPLILRSYVDEVVQTSKCPQVAMALYSGIVACGYTIARRIRLNWGDRGSSPYKVPVYVMALGGSGRGKNNPLEACSEMGGCYDKTCYGILTSPRSEQVVSEAVCEYKKVLLVFDEVGDALFSDKTNTFSIGLKRILKELYSASKKFTPPRSIASNNRMKQKLGTDRPIVNYPSAHVYATGIPSVVSKLMTDADLEEGLAGRFLICLEDQDSKVENNLANMRPFMLPENVEKWVESWGSLGGVEDFGITDAIREMSNDESVDYEPGVLTEANTALVYFEEDTNVRLTEIGDEYTNKSYESESSATVYRRGQHNVQILSIILACAEGDRYDNIPVKVKHVELAKQLVDYSIKCVEYLLANKDSFDDSTLGTKEDNSVYGRSVEFLKSWHREVFSVREFNAVVKVHGSSSRRALIALSDERLIEKTQVPNLYKIVR